MILRFYNENCPAPSDLHCLEQLPRLWEFKQRNSERQQKEMIPGNYQHLTERLGRHHWADSSPAERMLTQTRQHRAPLSYIFLLFSIWHKSLFKCRDLTGTSENCFPWSVYPIILNNSQWRKINFIWKWQSSNKMWPWIQMYLYWRKKCPFHSVTQIQA